MAASTGKAGTGWHRLAWGIASGLATGVVAAAILLKHEPAVVSAGSRNPDAERDAARIVTKGSALHAALGRNGPWGLAVADAELNAWFATDLPRNHARLLPRGLSEPRVRFHPQHVEAAVRLGSGLFSAVVWGDLQIALRGVNQLAIRLDAATLGAVPLPTAPVLAEIGSRIAALGAVTELRRLDGRMVLVVYIPMPVGGDGRHWRLESLRIDAGEAFVAGTADDGSAQPPPASEAAERP